MSLLMKFCYILWEFLTWVLILYWSLFFIISQYSYKSVPVLSFISLTCTRNLIGATTEPCGTPLITSLQDEYFPINIFLICLSCRKSFVHCSRFLWIPHLYWSFHINLGWGSLSKTFLKSHYILSTNPFSYFASLTYSSIVDLIPMIYLF